MSVKDLAKCIENFIFKPNDIEVNESKKLHVFSLLVNCKEKSRYFLAAKQNSTEINEDL
jgi:hypothetical protein